MVGTGTATNMVFNGGTLEGAGTLTLAPGGTSSFVSGVTSWLQGTAKLLNKGTMTQASQIYLLNNPKVENQGTWTLTYPGPATYNYDGLAKDPWLNTATGLLIG